MTKYNLTKKGIDYLKKELYLSQLGLSGLSETKVIAKDDSYYSMSKDGSSIAKTNVSTGKVTAVKPQYNPDYNKGKEHMMPCLESRYRAPLKKKD